MAIQVNPTVSPRIITVPEVDGVTITIQSLVNQCRNWEDEQVNLAYPHLISASGKEDLGGGNLVGITAKLENAKLKFADRGGPNYVQCFVKDGNLVAVDTDGNSINPIESSAYTQVQLFSSAAGTISETGISGLTQEESAALAQVEIIKAKTDVLQAEFEAVHGTGSWEGATRRGIFK